MVSNLSFFFPRFILTLFFVPEDDDNFANGSVSQDSSTAKTLVATLGSIEKTEDGTGLLLPKINTNIPILQTETGSDVDLTPEEAANDMNLTLQRFVVHPLEYAKRNKFVLLL